MIKGRCHGKTATAPFSMRTNDAHTQQPKDSDNWEKALQSPGAGAVTPEIRGQIQPAYFPFQARAALNMATIFSGGTSPCRLCAAAKI